MSRIAFAILGAVLAVFPKQTLAVYESLAIENRDECTRRSWVGPAVRVEGVVILAASLLGGKTYQRLLDFVGAAGAVALAAPKQYLGVGGWLGYQSSGTVEWNSRFITVARSLGGLVLLSAIRSHKRGGNDAAATEELAADDESP
ncbi:hypothetical protein C453_15348 [Haloferax elongans ATCC BAA-1513]|uniref:Uncharacterized protein n=1 Tax=Haloferax elongans ATCC BAA-1513 TaxID=1230453 RepID=M0HFB1_HALEO|nr:hypothetical protein [Haloferax elongans]ELZ82473.1 hypothetical protein C453_15348 [Haloferax elongans ATCC BAA-1513]